MATKIGRYNSEKSLLIGTTITAALFFSIIFSFEYIGSEDTALSVGLLLSSIIGALVTVILAGETESSKNGALASFYGTASITTLILVYGMLFGGEGIFSTIVGIIIGVIAIGGIAYVLGLIGGWSGTKLNAYQLSRLQDQEYQQAVQQYQDLLSAAEQQISDGEPTTDSKAYEEVRSQKKRCESLKSRYNISTTLWSENQRYAQLMGAFVKPKMQELIQKAEAASKRNDFNETSQVMDRICELAEEAESTASTYDTEIELPRSLEEAERDRATLIAEQEAEQAQNLISEGKQAIMHGDVSQGKNDLENAKKHVSKIEELTNAHGISSPLSSEDHDIDQKIRSYIEDRYEKLLEQIRVQNNNAQSKLNSNEYDQALQHAKSAIQIISDATALASEHVYLSKNTLTTKLDEIVSLATKTSSKRVAEIESTLRTKDGQKQAETLAEELEDAIRRMESLHNNNITDDTGQDIIVTASKAQQVMLAARLLTLEDTALSAEKKFKNRDYSGAKETFEMVVRELDSLKDSAHEDALKQYGTELDRLNQICNENADRARKLDLEIESGLSTESPEVIGPLLRNGKSGDSKAAGMFEESTSNTKVFDPSQTNPVENTTDTEVFSSNDSNTESDGPAKSTTQEAKNTEIYKNDDTKDTNNTQ
jgi:hypothetical protein